MAGEEKNGIGDKLIAEACKAFGIKPQYLFGSRYVAATETAILVTAGGKKVAYKPGDKVAPLDEISVTGINPKAAARKVIAGKEKGKE